MILANPIYDVVFKYLMEDQEIARGLLSKIIGENIVEIEVQPQEYVGRSDKFEIIILRLDFKATIKTESGTHKKVLIELQKGKNSADIIRFRKYLGDNYKREDLVSFDGIRQKEALPIISIYFLGFQLAQVPTAILKVNREYVDLITDKKIHTEEEFIEKLTHDSYVIQIPRLNIEVRNEMERVLKIFNQAYITTDHKALEFQEEDLEGDELLQLMADRLRKAATEEELLRKIEIEEEVESTIEKHIREKQKLVVVNAKLESILSEKDQALSEKDQALSEKDLLIEKLRNELNRKGQ